MHGLQRLKHFFQVIVGACTTTEIGSPYHRGYRTPNSGSETRSFPTSWRRCRGYERSCCHGDCCQRRKWGTAFYRGTVESHLVEENLSN